MRLLPSARDPSGSVTGSVAFTIAAMAGTSSSTTTSTGRPDTAVQERASTSADSGASDDMFAFLTSVLLAANCR